MKFLSVVIVSMTILMTSCHKTPVLQQPDPNVSDHTNENARIPAEWEPHEATWMQWPTEYEASMRPAFAEIIKTVKQYEPMHLIANSENDKTEAISLLTNLGISQENITWHVHAIDNSWMRDNGPIYVTNGTKSWIQDWKFDGWGTGFGPDIPWTYDNKIPLRVAEYLGMEVEDRQDFVLEKGNIEVNGAGILVLNWDCQKDRNPHIPRDQQETILKNAFGIDKVIWAFGHYAGDGTIGHIDGTARFVSENKIAVADYGSSLENDLAQACEEAGLEVVMYPGDPNWLVGNGFVLAMADEDAAHNELLRSMLEDFFPGRDIHMLDGETIAVNGGGIHCVTNDQPKLD